MAFAHFRRHEKLYLYIGLGTMFFALVVFSVPSALNKIAEGGEDVGLAGRFVDSSGESIEIPIDEYVATSRLTANFAGMYEAPEDLRGFEHIILAHEAKKAGIHVGDEMLREVLQASFGRLDGDQYRKMVSELYGGVRRFEKFMREIRAIGILKSMTTNLNVITGKDIYESFVATNQVLQAKYAVFPYSDFVVEASETEDETLQTFLDEMDENRRKTDYSTPERYGLDIAYLNYDEVNLADYAELLEGVAEPGDAEIERSFSFYRARYEELVKANLPDGPDGKKDGEKEEGEKENGDDTKSGDSPDENPSGSEDSSEDKAGSEDEVTEEEITVDQAREWVIKDLKLDGLLRKFETAYAEARKELAPKEDDTEDLNLPIPEDQINEALALKFTELVSTYKLQLFSTASPVEKSDIGELEHGADESLAFMVPVMKVGDIRVRPLRAGSKEGAIVRLVVKEIPVVKPLDEIRESLAEAYIEAEKRKQAEAAAKVLYEKARELARMDALERIEPIEKLAREAADKRIADESIVEEDAKQAIYDEELQKERPTIDSILTPLIGDKFEAAASALSIELADLGEFRERFQSSPAYRRLKNGPLKYLASFSSGLTQLEPGRMTGVLSDDESEACYIAKLIGKKDPTADSMTPKDRETSLNAVANERRFSGGAIFRQQGLPNPSAERNLKAAYKLESLLPRAEDDSKPGNN